VIKESVKIIKNEPLSVLVIFSLMILPIIFLEWIRFFPGFWVRIIIMISITLLWLYALCSLRVEAVAYRRKITLFNYLKRQRRHSINHITKKWAAKKEFTKRNIEKLVFDYPDVLKK